MRWCRKTPTPVIGMIRWRLVLAQFPPDMRKKAGGDNDRVDHTENGDQRHVVRLRQIHRPAASIGRDPTTGLPEQPRGDDRVLLSF